MRGATIIFVAGMAIIVVSQLSAFDIWLSDYAYDFDLGAWAIDHNSSIWRPILYEGTKALIIVFGLCVIAFIISPAWLPQFRISRQEAVFLLLCLAIVPATVGFVRQHSSVSCPRALQHYGGPVADEFGHVSLLGFFESSRPGACWPSGHASAGFALLCLACVGPRRRTRLKFAVFGLGVGSAMGAYQILRGAHFASHIVITMLIAVILVQGLRLAVLE